MARYAALFWKSIANSKCNDCTLIAEADIRCVAVLVQPFLLTTVAKIQLINLSVHTKKGLEFYYFGQSAIFIMLDPSGRGEVPGWVT